MLSPIISHVDILFCMFENRRLMEKFSISDLVHLKECIECVLSSKMLFPNFEVEEE